MHPTNIMRGLIAAVLVLSASFAGAYTINDNYIGADPTHNYSHVDVIGALSEYDTIGMNVAKTGTNLSVDIFTSFVTKTATNAIWGDQTHIGDLFIATGGWHPKGTAPYKDDSASNTGTIWDYVAVLTPHIPTIKNDTKTTGTIALYRFADGTPVLSNIGTLPTSNWIYRAGQYVQFTPTAGVAPVAVGTWNVDPTRNQTVNGVTYGDLSLLFDISEVVRASNEWGFHWAMTCANDVIEGQAHVPAPEPSTVLLVGVGLAGIGLLRRRSRK